jgi:hypothetical protein
MAVSHEIWLDAMLDAMVACTKRGVKMGDTWLFSAPDETFLAFYTPDKWISVTRRNNEDAGLPMLLVNLSEHSPQLVAFDNGPWLERLRAWTLQ